MILDKLKTKEFILLDGGMGTMLQKKGMQMGEIPELLSITKPEWILDIHKAYIEAGADVIYANTFGANAYKLKNAGYSVQEVIEHSIAVARQA
jgi:5-methyltetrahydrofolate--homocysteine methyltransferase